MGDIRLISLEQVIILRDHNFAPRYDKTEVVMLQDQNSIIFIRPLSRSCTSFLTSLSLMSKFILNPGLSLSGWRVGLLMIGFSTNHVLTLKFLKPNWACERQWHVLERLPSAQSLEHRAQNTEYRTKPFKRKLLSSSDETTNIYIYSSFATRVTTQNLWFFRRSF